MEIEEVKKVLRGNRDNLWSTVEVYSGSLQKTRDKGERNRLTRLIRDTKRKAEVISYTLSLLEK